MSRSSYRSVFGTLLRLRLSRPFARLRAGIPPFLFVALGLAAAVDLVRVLLPPLFASGRRLTVMWGVIPPWATTVVGLFIVIVVVGAALPKLYVFFESFVLLLAFGGSGLGIRLRTLARQDFFLLVESLKQDLDVTRPYAVILAIGSRLVSLSGLIRNLRNIEDNESRERYRETIERLRQGWRAGLQSSILLDYITILDRLPPPLDRDRLQGQVVAANVTYLLGDLRGGRRLADRTMEEAELLDPFSRNTFQWLASYAHANSRLFLGAWDDAARLLGERWQNRYALLTRTERARLFEHLSTLTTLNPVASVPRHIILASAFAGYALQSPATEPFPKRPGRSETASGSSGEWARRWYRLGTFLCRAEDISLHFTHGYMAIYCLVVDPLEDPRKILARIPQTAPVVSLYVKHGVAGLCSFKDRRFGDALTELRQADAYSRLSGNRFLDGIFLPVQAAAAAESSRWATPEVWRTSRRARVRAQFAQSAVYDVLVAASEAVIARKEGKQGKFERLKRRATDRPQGLVKIFDL